MNDPIPTGRARAVVEGDRADAEVLPIEVGRFAPYPVWMTVVLLIRTAQLLFLGWWVWYFAALFDAMSRPLTIATPPMWLMVVLGLIAADDGKHRMRWQRSPAGNWIGSLFASRQCPVCGQNVFDHTPQSGYEPPPQQYRSFPSRICTGCGHDLARRTAESG